MVQLFKPAILNEIGGRLNNQDAVYPESPDENALVFLVCDGVGGQKKGEVASTLICRYFPEYFTKAHKKQTCKNFLEEGLRYVESRLHEYINENPECSGMASTLTLLYFKKKTNSAVLGWVGDSRIYHIRDGSVIYQTKDHSEVQSLLDMGEITQEEAENHPRRNIITRAVTGRREVRIDVATLKDIQPNDFFLLCTDGILENLGIGQIKKWFNEEQNPDYIKDLIYENAKGKTKDNYSMCLLKVKKLTPLYLKGKIQASLEKWGW
jgi:serine/threonine protein phosphatase PrpC